MFSIRLTVVLNDEDIKKDLKRITKVETLNNISK